MAETKMMMKKILWRASLAKMTNPAGWWAPSLTRYSIAWSIFGTSRSSLTNCRNEVGETRPTTAVRGIWSPGWTNWRSRLTFKRNQLMMQCHLRQRHLVSLGSFTTWSPENCKCRKWRLNRGVVKWPLVCRFRTDTTTFGPSRPHEFPIRLRLRNRSMSNPSASTHAYWVASEFPYRNWIPTKTWWRLLRCQRIKCANWNLWRCINLRRNTSIYFATCQLLIDFGGQIMRHDNSSMHVQGSDRPCQCSRLQISLTDNQWTWYRPAHYWLVRQWKPHQRQNSLTKYKWVM